MRVEVLPDPAPATTSPQSSCGRQRGAATWSAGGSRCGRGVRRGAGSPPSRSGRCPAPFGIAATLQGETRQCRMGRLVGRGAARVELRRRHRGGDGAEGGLPASDPSGDVAFTQAEGVPAVEGLKDGRPVGGPEGEGRAPDRAAQHVGVAREPADVVGRPDWVRTRTPGQKRPWVTEHSAMSAMRPSRREPGRGQALIGTCRGVGQQHE